MAGYGYNQNKYSKRTELVSTNLVVVHFCDHLWFFEHIQLVLSTGGQESQTAMPASDGNAARKWNMNLPNLLFNINQYLGKKLAGDFLQFIRWLQLCS